MDPRNWGNDGGSGSNPGAVNDFGNYAGWLESDIFQTNYFTQQHPPYNPYGQLGTDNFQSAASNAQQPPPYSPAGGMTVEGFGSQFGMHTGSSYENVGGDGNIQYSTYVTQGQSMPNSYYGSPLGGYDNTPHVNFDYLYGTGAGTSSGPNVFEGGSAPYVNYDNIYATGAGTSSGANVFEGDTWETPDEGPGYRSVGGILNSSNSDDDDDTFSLPDDDIEAQIWAEDEAELDAEITIALFEALQERQRKLNSKKIPFHTSPLQGRGYIDDLLNAHSGRFNRELKMPKSTFHKLVEELQTIYGWQVGKGNGVQCDEALAMFIFLLRGFDNHELQERFQHSGETVSRHVHKMLRCLRRFNYDKLKLTRSQDDPHPYLDWRPFYAPFKLVERGHTMTTQYSSGSFTTRGKFYLVDAGYPNKHGFLASYKGYRYHQPEFRQGRRRINDDNEFFNRVHSSLRSCIERTIGVFKSRFPVVYCMPWYSIRTQVQIILSAMAFHNFIRRDRDPEEDMFHVVERPEEYTFQDLPDANPANLEDLEDTPDFGVGNEENDPVMNDIRNNIKAELRDPNLLSLSSLSLRFSSEGRDAKRFSPALIQSTF
ncbi:hypothetical protein Vadar_030892 [Vaccinium darrowii]|uniref:Uncharacterized protein n=1 Tax=Vaccinium darrowii TaxID=229202 RepID=A0ACB7YR99_9ERIC|nr:hypothetical protein Vadar_030892 [Vaccinium darrowii]